MTCRYKELKPLAMSRESTTSVGLWSMWDWTRCKADSTPLDVPMPSWRGEKGGDGSPREKRHGAQSGQPNKRLSNDDRPDTTTLLLDGHETRAEQERTGIVVETTHGNIREKSHHQFASFLMRQHGQKQGVSPTTAARSRPPTSPINQYLANSLQIERELRGRVRRTGQGVGGGSPSRTSEEGACTPC